MAGHWTQNFSFVSGAIRQKDLGYVILSDDRAAESKIPLAGIVQWEPDGWGDGGQVGWRTAGVAVVRKPIEQLCAVGEFGQALLLGSGDRHEETIGDDKRSPGNRGPLRGVRLIGEHVYVVGMDRQVYRRDNVNRWIELDHGARPDPKNKDTVGFEAVDGYSETEIYAVGWDGEIWQFDGHTWKRRNSPTNAVLVDVCCAGNGMVYACGRNGLVVRGRNDKWEVLELREFSEDIWSLAWYQERVYLASMENLFVLNGDQLEIVDMGKDRAKTCYDLVTGDGVLWSIGFKDAMAFDGKQWSRID